MARPRVRTDRRHHREILDASNRWLSTSTALREYERRPIEPAEAAATLTQAGLDAEVT
jgi:hypothetical protein